MPSRDPFAEADTGEVTALLNHRKLHQHDVILLGANRAQVMTASRLEVVELVRLRCRSHCRQGAGAGSSSETEVPEPK
jgi:hypothetical protein